MCVPKPGTRCRNKDMYNVWFEKCNGLYTSMCAKHTAEAVARRVFGYRVVQISAIFPYLEDTPPTHNKRKPMNTETILENLACDGWLVTLYPRSEQGFYAQAEKDSKQIAVFNKNSLARAIIMLAERIYNV